MARKKVLEVWYQQTDKCKLPGFCKYEDDLKQDGRNGDEVVIRCSFRKPGIAAKRIKITIEDKKGKI